MIRVDCYLRVIKAFQKKYRGCHNIFFKVITIGSRSNLAPSSRLLHLYMTGKYNFEQYRTSYLREIKNNIKAIQEIKHIIHLNNLPNSFIFLVCYEKNPKKCHRGIVKDIIDKYYEMQGGIELVINSELL